MSLLARTQILLHCIIPAATKRIARGPKHPNIVSAHSECKRDTCREPCPPNRQYCCCHKHCPMRHNTIGTAKYNYPSRWQKARRLASSHVSIRVLGAKSLCCCYHYHNPTRHFTSTSAANRRKPPARRQLDDATVATQYPYIRVAQCTTGRDSR